MKGEARKAAVAAYKERKPAAGIYAVRCAPTGQSWLGRARDLATIQTRIWFSLQHGGASNRALQAAWQAHGAEAFTFEAIERLEVEESAYVRDALLKERLAHWRAVLGAAAL
ncbi:GIY-YIG nuclease family protein [Roseixanthobacter glucoisosaccharinicivorans]|uniref:GIY-YIG nuclease family protein n=1 Tax=Roseixanthobacter glucoisosaccharinicivorans TaxID=3119923 RepID=UPI00372C4277